MKVLITLFIMTLLMGCENAYQTNAGHVNTTGQDDVYVVLDSKRSVTCYVYNGSHRGGLHCFTAAQLFFQEN